MARFRFRLESLKKYRNDRLIKAEKELSELNSQHVTLTEKLRYSHRMRRESLLSIKGQGSVGIVKLFAEFSASESIRIKMLNVELEKLEQEVERYRSWVEHLHRELKIVEKLEEKRRFEFEEELKKKEMKEIDAWVVERWQRR